jgi:hypothetical protein
MYANLKQVARCAAGAAAIQQDDPKMLRGELEVILSHAQFERFSLLCKQTKPPSSRMLDAAKRLDSQGF